MKCSPLFPPFKKPILNVLKHPPTVMNSAAFLRRGIAPTPPIPALGLSLTLRHVSFNCGGGQSQRCKNGLQIIRCGRYKEAQSSNRRSGGGPLANATMALQSLVCFSLNTAAEPETKKINDEKKRALQNLLGGNDGEAETIMTNLLNSCRNSPASIKYDAALALLQILIHIGTQKSLDTAIGHLNNIEEMAAAESLPSDAKRPFYRAVIYTLLEEIDDAQQNWNIFTRAIGSGPRRR